jgi:hypothetical protein
MKIFILVASAIFLCCITFSSCSSNKKIYKQGNSITMQPRASDGIDSYIEYWNGDNYSNRTWGDYDAFAAVAWTSKGDPLIVQCLIKFNLKGIDKKTKIKRATLSLYAISTPGIGEGHSTMSGSNAFALKKITEPWDEYTVTWNTQPATTKEDQVVLPASTNDMQDYEDIDITTLIQEMISIPNENHRLMIELLNQEYYRRVVFGSSDNADPMKRPKLVIEF